MARRWHWQEVFCRWALGEITVNYGQGAAYSYAASTPSLTATLSAGVLTIADSVPLGLSISHLTVVRDGNDVVITDSNEEFSLTVPVGTASQ